MVRENKSNLTIIFKNYLKVINNNNFYYFIISSAKCLRIRRKNPVKFMGSFYKHVG
jgi:hypothetical protein